MDWFNQLSFGQFTTALSNSGFGCLKISKPSIFDDHGGRRPAVFGKVLKNPLIELLHPLARFPFWRTHTLLRARFTVSLSSIWEFVSINFTVEILLALLSDHVDTITKRFQ